MPVYYHYANAGIQYQDVYEFFTLLSQQPSATFCNGQKAAAMLGWQLTENKTIKYCSLLSV